MSVDNKISNKSGNRPFSDIVQINLSRRKVLVGSLVTAVGTFLSIQSASGNSGLQSDIKGKNIGDSRGLASKNYNLVGFKSLEIEYAIAQGKGATVPVISEDYEFQYLIPWGESLYTDNASYYGASGSRPSFEGQTKQIGIGHDGMCFFPPKNGNANQRGILAINHEFGRNIHVLGKSAPQNLEDVQLSQHAHGVSVVEIAKIGDSWQLVKDNMTEARRIHVNTPVTFSGPAAGDPLLGTPAGTSPAGTMNNCSNGHTPWGTYLTCEENFNGYFGAKTPENWISTPEQDRYGFTENGFDYGWEDFEDRFDLSNPMHKNEENRFGWVVEIDPYDNTQIPVKRTALGRIKHEGVALTVGKDERVVAYMGDDQAFDYIYKFVSADNWRLMRSQGISPLDEGKLYVAKFNDDGTGAWLELTIDNPDIAAHFSSQAQVLVYARKAADILGATPMDRPEWITIAPDGQIYCTLTNNRGRILSDEANPEAPNSDGHIIRWTDIDNHTGTTFEWDIFLLASEQRGKEWTFTNPDGLWADPDGRLFIQTDGNQPDGLQDQMLVADTTSDNLLIKRLFMGVAGDEITGCTVTPDRKTMFVNIQHPGNGDPSKTNIPAATDGMTIPRDCTVVITKKDGGVIGS